MATPERRLASATPVKSMVKVPRTLTVKTTMAIDFALLSPVLFWIVKISLSKPGESAAEIAKRSGRMTFCRRTRPPYRLRKAAFWPGASGLSPVRLENRYQAIDRQTCERTQCDAVSAPGPRRERFAPCSPCMMRC